MSDEGDKAPRLVEGTTPKPHRYRLYLDESGDHTYNQLDDLSRRYLGLLGVWFRQADDYVAFDHDMNSFKQGIFGARPDKPVVLHRSCIINRKGPFGVLCDPEIRRRFNDGLLGVIQRAKCHVACVVIDKQTHSGRYDNPLHPYHYCLAAMLDRYSGWLNYKTAVGDVMAEGRGREEDLQLAQAYRRVYEGGTIMFSHSHHQKALTSKDIKIQSKRANLPGLQLADILAHPVKQAMLIEKGLIPETGDVYGKQIIEAVDSKFNKKEGSGQVSGYGKVWL